ncbi:MAG: helicase-related protein [Patescibacteria group bacterium]|mgnify:CR=1 FL=1
MEIKGVGSRIVLRISQVSHFRRLDNILDFSHVWIDGSPMGSGKTWISGALAIKKNLPLYVVCPKNVQSVWEDMARRVGIDIAIYSYEAFRGSRFSQPKSGLLKRVDSDMVNENGKLLHHKVEFFATEYLKQLIDNGIMFIFDEGQRLKNGTSQNLAARKVARMILSSETGLSRLGLLSGTMYDKEEHCVQFLNLIGYLRHEKLVHYIPSTRELKLLGLSEIIDACLKIGKELTEGILATNVGIMNAKNARKIAYNLYTGVVLKKIGSVAPPPIGVEVDIANGFYRMEDRKIAEYVQNLQLLVSSGKSFLGEFTKILMKLEETKLATMTRLARNVLESEENSKVILFVNYKASVEKLSKDLDEYGPLRYYGDIADSTKRMFLKAFQAPNSDYRLFVATLHSGGMGISLHDTNGRFPRRVFGIPNFSAIEMQQATYRIFREGTKSNGKVRFIYDYETGELETRMLDILHRKTTVLEDQIMENRGKMIFPGDYPSEYENSHPEIRKSEIKIVNDDENVSDEDVGDDFEET